MRTTARKIVLPLFLLFLMGVVSAYTSTHPDMASETTLDVLIFVNELIPYWPIFIFAVLIVVIIAILKR